MRLLSVSIVLVALLVPVAGLRASPATEKMPTPADTREAALEHVLTERGSLKALDEAIAAARNHHVSEQAILEARFLYHIDRSDDLALTAMLPAMLKQREGFKIEDSAIFAVKEDWEAIVEYVQALTALGNDDKPSFKQHITEAFWLSPRQASAFAPHIDRLRLKEAMRGVKIDFSLKFAPMATGEPVSLESLVAGKKALLFHFWSPMSRECEASMADFSSTAKMLLSHDIAVVSLVSDDSPQLIAEARAMIEPLGENPPGAWLVDAKPKSLARDLRIQNLPAMVLVSSAGNILFHGDPTESPFWVALRAINPRIQRPSAAALK